MRFRLVQTCCLCVMSCEELTVAAEICEDLWVPQSAKCSSMHRQVLHVIVNLSASDEIVGKRCCIRRALVTGQSARLICGYVYATAGEGESSQDLVFRRTEL